MATANHKQGSAKPGASQAGGRNPKGRRKNRRLVDIEDPREAVASTKTAIFVVATAVVAALTGVAIAWSDSQNRH